MGIGTLRRYHPYVDPVVEEPTTPPEPPVKKFGKKLGKKFEILAEAAGGAVAEAVEAGSLVLPKS